MLRTRLVTSLLAIPVVVAAFWFGEPWFTILIAVVALLAVIEFYRLAAATGASPLPYFGMVFTTLFVVSRNPDVVAWLEPHFDVAPVTPLLLTLTVALPMAWLVLRRRAGQTFTGWAWTVAGILYTGWLLGHLVSLRALPDGRSWVLFVLLATFASDTTAFFAGSRFGRRRLSPEISPNKTWEGAIAGLAGAAALGLVFAAATVFTADNPLHISGLALWQAA
ncbi:MAG: phosphatidate cytidylyltransferase, partial [Dehalococcoidales bacterium]